ncbi:MAG: CRTAC1 family protein [Bacteroidia bacterium]
MRISIYIFGIALLLASCNGKTADNGKTMFKLLDASVTGIDFVNEVIETDEMNIGTYEYIYNGNGVSVGDINNDGLLDLFFTSNQGDCKLYVNEGEFSFSEITASSGIKTSGFCTGTVMADVNNDGYTDIYVCRDNPFFDDSLRENLLFINNGDMTFTEQGASYGVNDNGYSSIANFFDADNDGDLDLFVGNHPIEFERDIRKFSIYELNDDKSTDRLYFNNGDGTFTDHTMESGVASHSFTLSTSATDFNQDGFTDLYVCNDYFGMDFCYINNGDGTFTESHKELFKHASTNAMGSDAADFNNDGLVDLVVLDMLPQDNYNRKLLSGPSNFDFYIIRLKNNYGHQNMKNTLQINSGGGQFNEIGCFSGILATDWSWAPLFADYDNDGWKDLYVTNGYYRDVTNMDFISYKANFLKKNNRNLTINELAEQLPNKRTANYAFKNNGDLTFSDVSAEWGLDIETVSNGAAYADLNNDGKLDLIACNMNQEAHIYENTSPDKSYVDIKLKGDVSNKQGIGAKVTVYSGGKMQFAENFTVRGYNSSVSPLMHFGLGELNEIDSIKVIWPSRKMSVVYQPTINQVLEINESEAKALHIYIKEDNASFVDVSEEVLKDISHSESGYVDYKREPLIPHMFSKRGPGISVADVNGDGLEDFIMSGSFVSAPQLFTQNTAGSFTKKEGPWSTLAEVETVASHFFDCDGDGDLDLYLASGSNEYSNPKDPRYQDLLYINDGSGNFTVSDGLPSMIINSGCVTSGDIDGDGDLDLFVGGNVIAGQYPKHHRSYLLTNDGGKFSDVTDQWNESLKDIGLINTAQFVDYDGNGSLDLLIAGEWMSPKLFTNSGNAYKDESSALGLGDYIGWWNSAKAADFDGDGDIDIMAGNIGLNSQFMASTEKPIYIDYGDMDGNGSFDAMVSQYYDDVLAPIYSKDEMSAQMRYFMNTHFKFYEDFSKATTASFLDVVKGEVTRLSANTMQSIYFENGGSSFIAHTLPAEAQFSPMFDFLPIEQDGESIILGVGNSYDNKVEFGWTASSNGLYLKFDKDGNLYHSNGSGFYVPNVAKGIYPISINGQTHYLVSINHGKLKLFKPK